MTDRPSPRPSPSRRQATLPVANPARRLAALAAAGLGLALAACGGANGPGAGNAAAGAAAVSASSSATRGTTAASGAAQRLPQTAFGGRVAEPASGWSDKPGWSSARSMIVAANPLAAQAGAEILKAGGSAVDAAIAAQLVLTLTEPQSSGLGGGALLLYADDKTTDAYDGLETAPAAATERLFLDRDGKLLGPAQTVAGGRPVGVPGTLRMLELAHRAHGKLPWKRLFQPAIKLADQGFPISPRLAALIASDPYLRADPAARTRSTAARSPARSPPRSANPGLLTQQDLGRYRALPRTPFCGDYRKWTLCGMPPPASGGLAIAQMFGLFDGLPDWRKLGGQKLVRNDVGGLEPTPQAAHLFSEAGRLAYADRARYLADPERVPAPAGDWQRLVAPTYLAQRLQRIGDTSLGHAEAGVPADSTLATSFGDDPDALAPPPAASELAVVDHDGAVVAMASSLGDPFGSRLMVRGFLLNDALTGFSRTPRDHGRPIANRLDGGKRPRSSLTPEIAFERGTRRVALVLGGADAMPVAKTLAGVTDWGLTVAQAIALPNFGSRNGPTELEAGRVSDTLVEGLRRRGHEVRLVPITSDLVGLQRVALDGQSLWLGTADPRREGAAAGD
ncbi:gamma-glutamyltransferase [Burkholderia gladioli]|uniref:gamma-glutamyltransferase family protein n=1 Tax=Burkholderia gladioli TaxID=28095 RepID=UPI00164008E8